MKIMPGMLIAAALAFGSGCARSDWIERTLVTVDVTGIWYGQGPVPTPTDVWLDLKQVGPKAKGSMRARGPLVANYTAPVPWSATGPIEGTVAGDVFSFRQMNGVVTGELTVSGDEMKGTMLMQGKTVPIVLHRVGSSSRPDPGRP